MVFKIFPPWTLIIPGCYSHSRHPIPEWFYVKATLKNHDWTFLTFSLVSFPVSHHLMMYNATKSDSGTFFFRGARNRASQSNWLAPCIRSLMHIEGNDVCINMSAPDPGICWGGGGRFYQRGGNVYEAV